MASHPNHLHPRTFFGPGGILADEGYDPPYPVCVGEADNLSGLRTRAERDEIRLRPENGRWDSTEAGLAADYYIRRANALSVKDFPREDEDIRDPPTVIQRHVRVRSIEQEVASCN